MKQSSLLDKMLAAAGLKTAPAAEAETEATATDAITGLQAEVDTLRASLAEAETKLAAQAVEIEGKVAAAAGVADAIIATLTAQLEAANEAATKLVADAAAAKLSDRETKILAAVGTERAPALVAATAGMDDAAFNAVLAAVETSTKAESKTRMFTEIGADGAVDPAKAVATESVEMQILRAEYANKAK